MTTDAQNKANELIQAMCTLLRHEMKLEAFLKKKPEDRVIYFIVNLEPVTFRAELMQADLLEAYLLAVRTKIDALQTELDNL